MPVDTVADFVEVLRRGRLLEPAQVEELIGTLQARCPEPRALAAELVRRGWLSAYQIGQLFEGRGDELLLGSYVLIERLGAGGMGEVFKAKNWKLGKVVAVKLIRRERLSNLDTLRRFQREVRVAAQLNHPHFVHAYDCDESGGKHFFVMEYVEGIDLARLVKENGPLPLAEACDCVRQAALGLQYAYERGLVHRDIKPHNLLRTRDSDGRMVVKILDMGLARLSLVGEDGGTTSTMTQEGTVMGTLDYIAPEQALNAHQADVRADLYSLGCTFYFLLTGRVPFPGGTAAEKLLKHQLESPTPIEQLRPEVPAAVAAIVRKLMAKRPEDRYSTPAAAAADLALAWNNPDPFISTVTQQYVPTPAVGAMEETDPSWSSIVSARTAVESGPPPRRRWVWLAAAGGVLLGLVGLLVFLLRDGKPPAPDSRPIVAEQEPRKEKSAPTFEQWQRRVTELPADEQVKEVAAKLQEFNPGFDGTVTPTIQKGVVVRLAFGTDRVTDIRPLRALPGLRSLDCRGSAPGKGRLSDLSPLKGMGLFYLACPQNPIADLSPLKGMRLINLNCSATAVVDLSPLKDMPLEGLVLRETGVSDLSLLRGMPLSLLNIAGSPVADLSPLRGATLRNLACNFRCWRDLDIARSLKTLDTINSKPAAEFWKQMDAARANFDTWCQRVAAMKPDRQVLAVSEQLKRRNPGFDGEIKPTIQNGVIVRLEFVTDRVTDISPVRALPRLRALFCLGSAAGKGQLSDLSPLKGMALTVLNCHGNRVADLSPLQGMPVKQLFCGATSVADLSPLEGMSLTSFGCGGNRGITDLSPLRGMPLTMLNCQRTQVSDLSPLRGMRLTSLACQGTRVTDLSPLKDMPLKVLTCNFQPDRDIEVLRSLKDLERINGEPVAEFWKKIGVPATKP